MILLISRKPQPGETGVLGDGVCRGTAGCAGGRWGLVTDEAEGVGEDQPVRGWKMNVLLRRLGFALEPWGASRVV